MKKQSSIVREKTFYKIIWTIGSATLIEKENGLKALVNLNTEESLLFFDNYLVDADFKSGIVVFKRQYIVNGKEVLSPTVSIWDSEFFRCHDWTIKEEIHPNKTIVLASPYDRKLHLFDRKIHETDASIFETQLDKVEVVPITGKKPYLILTANNKKGIYKPQKGLIAPIEFDYISQKEDRFILTKGTQKKFLFNDILSSNYDDIEFDKNYPNIVYFRTDNTTYAFYVPGMIPIIKTRSEHIELAHKSTWPKDYRGLYRFIIKDKDGFTIRENYITEIKEFTEGNLLTKEGEIYDNIYYQEGKYYLEKDGKVTPFTKTLSNKEYDKIVPLGDDLYAHFSGERCDIGMMKNESSTILVEDCRIITNIPNAIILETDEGMTLLSHYKTGEHYLVTGDNIRHLGLDYFEIEKAGFTALYQHGKFYTDMDNLNIEIHIDNETSPEYIHVALEKTDGYQLMILHHQPKTCAYEVKRFTIQGMCDKVELFKDFIHLEYTSEQSFPPFKQTHYNYITTYDKRYIKALPLGSKIKISGQLGNQTKNGVIYTIDGVDYIFQPDPVRETFLQEIKSFPSDLYMAAYQGEFGTVVVNSHDRNGFADECKKIEVLNDEKFDTILKEYYDRTPKVQERYPTLSIKPIKKD